MYIDELFLSIIGVFNLQYKVSWGDGCCDVVQWTES